MGKAADGGDRELSPKEMGKLSMGKSLAGPQTDLSPKEMGKLAMAKAKTEPDLNDLVTIRYGFFVC